MKKNVYSLVLSEDVVHEIDKMAYRQGTNRSNLVNQILAEYASLITPERRISHLLSEVRRHFEEAAGFQLPAATAGGMTLRTALQYIGARYRHGTSGPHTFDCSGFTSFVYRQKNIKLSRSSVIQWTQGTEVKELSELKPGDLIFFQGPRMTKRVGHVGLVKEVNPEKGDVSFIHAALTGVRVDKLSMDYYKKRFIGFRRVL